MPKGNNIKSRKIYVKPIFSGVPRLRHHVATLPERLTLTITGFTGLNISAAAIL